MPLTRVGPFDIAYRAGGKGEAVLLLHGITTYSFLWKEVVPSIEGDFAFFAPDLLGCGDSSKPAGADYSLSAQAGIVLQFMENLGIAKAHLRAPGRLLSLTLINTVGYDYWPVQPIVSMRIPLLRHLAMAAFDLGVLRMLVLRTFHHKEKVDANLMAEFMRPLQSDAGKAGFLALARSLDNTQVLEVSHRLSSLSIPVLIIRGDKDIYLKPVISERLHGEIPGSRYEIITTAGHFSPLDDPDAVAALLLRHFSAARAALP
jgi:pimeloyl-ACP methyl ester carboxylesterase